MRGRLHAVEQTDLGQIHRTCAGGHDACVGVLALSQPRQSRMLSLADALMGGNRQTRNDDEIGVSRFVKGNMGSNVQPAAAWKGIAAGSNEPDIEDRNLCLAGDQQFPVPAGRHERVVQAKET